MGEERREICSERRAFPSTWPTAITNGVLTTQDSCRSQLTCSYLSLATCPRGREPPNELQPDTNRHKHSPQQDTNRWAPPKYISSSGHASVLDTDCRRDLDRLDSLVFPVTFRQPPRLALLSPCRGLDLSQLKKNTPPTAGCGKETLF